MSTIRDRFFMLLGLVGLCYAADNPCTDTQYVRLKGTSMENMTEREFKYFMVKEKYCLEHSATADPTEPESCQVLVNVLRREDYVPGVDSDTYKRFLAMAVYLDNIKVGTPPVARFRSLVGRHTVSLFSERQFQAEGPGDRERLSTGFVTVDFAPSTRTEITFVFRCDVARNRVCDDNEWQFKSSVESHPIQE